MEVIVIITFADGSLHRAVILRQSDSVIRLALKDRADAVELTFSGDAWFCSEVQQKVFLEFSPEAEGTHRRSQSMSATG